MTKKMVKISSLKLAKLIQPLLISLMALALLSQYTGINIKSETSYKASILLAENTIAGSSGRVEIETEPLSELEVLIEDPSGKTFTFQSSSNKEGRATLTIDSTYLQKSGEYYVSVRPKDESASFSSKESFSVYPMELSESKSTLSINKNVLQGGENLEMKVALKDELFNPLAGRMVQVIPSDPSVNVYSQDFMTDENGEMKFYALIPEKEENSTVNFTVVDIESQKKLRAKPQISIIGRKSNTASNNTILLSSDSGPLDHFDISLGGQADTTLEVGDYVDVIVSALDKDENIVKDYTGTIRFSSSDGSATLPNDYSFLAEDGGSHTFSLALKFVTPGIQTINVNDTEKYSIEGVFEVEVLTEGGSSSPDYGSDFVENDFDREGDFTLISPASGSYSNNSIEVQGGAQYGYSVIIYLNEEEAGRTEVEFDESFSYSISNLEDGKYEIYVEIVETEEDESGKENILQVIETSATESVVIDSTPPELMSIEANPAEIAAIGSEVEITVLSEGGLDDVSLIFEDEIYTLEESETSGKYVGSIIMPEEAGNYSLDVLLTDPLGNDVQYRDQLILKAESQNEEVSTEEVSTEEAQNIEESIEINVGEVKGLTAMGDEESVLLSWEVPESDLIIVNYKIYYGPTPESLFATSETLDSSNSWRISNLTGGETYYFAVSAIDIEGNESPPSKSIAAMPLSKKTSVTSPPPENSEYVPYPDAAPKFQNLPPETPQTGAGTGLLITLSAISAAAFTRRRRK